MAFPKNHPYHWSAPFVTAPPLRPVVVAAPIVLNNTREVVRTGRTLLLAGTAFGTGAVRSIVEGGDAFELDQTGNPRLKFMALPPGNKEVVVRQVSQNGETLDTTLTVPVVPEAWHPLTADPELVLNWLQQNPAAPGALAATHPMDGFAKLLPSTSTSVARSLDTTVGATRPAQTADNKGITFTGNQFMRWNGTTGTDPTTRGTSGGVVARANRNTLLIFRIDGTSGTTNDRRLYCINDSSGKSGRMPVVMFKKGIGITVSWNSNSGGPQIVLTFDNVVADGTTWNHLIVYRRHGRLFARLNGVEKIAPTVQFSHSFGEIPSFISDNLTTAPTWALDTFAVMQSDPSEARVNKLEAWARQRIATLPGGAPFTGTPPVHDADDFDHRYYYEPDKWRPWRRKQSQWRATSTFKGLLGLDMNNLPAAIAPDYADEYVTTFKDDFRRKNVGISVRTETDPNIKVLTTPYFAPSPNPAIGSSGSIEASDEQPHAELYIHDPVKKTLNLAMRASGDTTLRVSGMGSVNNEGLGYTWEGPTILRCRVRFPSYPNGHAGTPWFAAPIWRYSLGYLLRTTEERIEFDDWEQFGYAGSSGSMGAMHSHGNILGGVAGHTLIDTMKSSTHEDPMDDSGRNWSPFSDPNYRLFPGAVKVFDGQMHTVETRIDETWITQSIDGKMIGRVPTISAFLERWFLMTDNVPKGDDASWRPFIRWSPAISKIAGTVGNGTMLIPGYEDITGTVNILGRDEQRQKADINYAREGTWQVRFSSATTYTVRTPAGVTTNHTVGAKYAAPDVSISSANIMLAHTMTAGSTPFQAGDGFDVVVTPIIHDMEIDTFEVLQPASVKTRIRPPFTAQPTLTRVGDVITCTPNVSGITDVWYYWFDATGYPLCFGIDPTLNVTAHPVEGGVQCMVKAVGYRDTPECWSELLPLVAAVNTLPAATHIPPTLVGAFEPQIGTAYSTATLAKVGESGYDAYPEDHILLDRSQFTTQPSPRQLKVEEGEMVRIVAPDMGVWEIGARARKHIAIIGSTRNDNGSTRGQDGIALGCVSGALTEKPTVLLQYIRNIGGIGTNKKIKVGTTEDLNSATVANVQQIGTNPVRVRINLSALPPVPLAVGTYTSVPGNRKILSIGGNTLAGVNLPLNGYNWSYDALVVSNGGLTIEATVSAEHNATATLWYSDTRQIPSPDGQGVYPIGTGGSAYFYDYAVGGEHTDMLFQVEDTLPVAHVIAENCVARFNYQGGILGENASTAEFRNCLFEKFAANLQDPPSTQSIYVKGKPGGGGPPEITFDNVFLRQIHGRAIKTYGVYTTPSTTGTISTVNGNQVYTFDEGQPLQGAVIDGVPATDFAPANKVGANWTGGNYPSKPIVTADSITGITLALDTLSTSLAVGARVGVISVQHTTKGEVIDLTITANNSAGKIVGYHHATGAAVASGSTLIRRGLRVGAALTSGTYSITVSAKVRGYAYPAKTQTFSVVVP